MKIKSVIVDTTLPLTGTLNPALWQYNQQILIDWQITKIQNSGREAIVVLGDDGDEILRKAKHLDFCDLVFSSDKTYLAGLHAGLHGSGVCAFYLPVEVTFPDEHVWATLEREYIKLPYNHKTHILKPETEIDTYPWLITKLGRDTIVESGKIIVPDLSQRAITIDFAINTNSPTKTIG